jgi:proline iminopeptidase
MEGAAMNGFWIACLLLAATPGGTPTATTNGRMMHANGVSLWVETRGGGTAMPLMVLNGGPGVSHQYLLVSSVCDSLARRRPVIFYDQRGTGLSPALAKDQSCTLSDQIANLDSLRALLGFARMDVLGHSWGGNLAMAYAARHPDRINRLIICDSEHPSGKKPSSCSATCSPM